LPKTTEMSAGDFRWQPQSHKGPPTRKSAATTSLPQALPHLKRSPPAGLPTTSPIGPRAASAAIAKPESGSTEGVHARCEIVWLVATEHLYNMTNIGLNVHSDMLRDIRRKKK
jgi:hypothetical protein